MYIVAVSFKITFVAQRMFPIAALPNSSLPFCDSAPRTFFASADLL